MHESVRISVTQHRPLTVCEDQHIFTWWSFKLWIFLIRSHCRVCLHSSQRPLIRIIIIILLLLWPSVEKKHFVSWNSEVLLFSCVIVHGGMQAEHKTTKPKEKGDNGGTALRGLVQFPAEGTNLRIEQTNLIRLTQPLNMSEISLKRWLTVLHFSMSVLISGLTFSIRSTRLPLLFIIPPGITNTLVPVTGRQREEGERVSNVI